MVRTLQAKEAIEKMDKLGAAHKPFLFVIDYDISDIIIIEKKDLSNFDVLFSFGESQNLLSNSTAPQLSINPISYDHYRQSFDDVMRELNYGNSFLLNLTFSTEITNCPSIEEIYAQAKARYKLYIKDRLVVFSPETFVQVEDRIISSYPMKGTIDADLPDAEKLLLENEKEEAEHYTIVDLIRNDLSQVAKDVHVSKFRYIERIKSNKKHLLQASSEIMGTLPIDHHEYLGTWFFKLLPAGSITGAPKRKTMEIIQHVEADKRGYYTGVMGYYDGRNLDSSVMIRYIEKSGDKHFYRSGGGITYLSDAQSEYQELLDKIYLPY